MKIEFTKEELLELERQLSCPNGEVGIEVGRNMNKTNISMTLSAIAFLNIRPHNTVLELGHGNCGHLEKLISTANGINYYGLEVSKTMLAQALKINPNFKSAFKLYDGVNIPFSNEYFDRIMSVNTIYFWTNKIMLIKEIERTLKPMGICVLAYVDKEYMKTLPFVGNRFTLFNETDIKKLVANTQLKIIELKNKTEQVISKTGATVQREYTMVKLIKL